MTIDEAFARLVLNTGRIAEALEAIAGSQGIVSGELQPDEPSDKAEAVPKKKTGKKKKGKKAKETKVGKTDDSDIEAEYTLKEIRALLHRLQEQENQAAVKSILKAQGASTLGQVDEKNYAKLADAIAEKLDD